MNIDENNRLSQRFDQWYSRFAHFPDHVFRNGCANQNRVLFVVFPRLYVRREKEPATVWCETNMTPVPKVSVLMRIKFVLQVLPHVLRAVLKHATDWHGVPF